MKRSGMLAGAVALVLVAAWLVAPVAVAQVTAPVASPYAKVAERVGITDITIKYNRPGVNGRSIWGSVVPYGLSAPFPGFGSGNAFPWRAGANENTTISFEHDVLVEGQPLAAGTYGLHMIPQENSPWTIIFSHNTSSWGSFFYDEAEDALRVTVTPVAAPHQERLAYEFTDHQGNDEVTIALRWEEMKVPFRVKVDNLHEVVMASMRDELRSSLGFNPQSYASAAGYALNNNLNHEEALGWIERAVGQNKTFNNLRIKSGLQAQMGQSDAAEATMAEAIEIANQNQLNFYGYQLMGQGDMERAGEIFRLNVERHPDAWNPHDSLGEYYAKAGDKANAIKYYKMALDKLPASDQANHDRITGVLTDLEAQGSE